MNPSSWNLKKITIPDYSSDLAEFVGIVLGDGNVYSFNGANIAIRISGDSRYDSEYLREYVAPLVERLFSLKPAFYQSKRSNCLHMIIRSRVLVDFFENMGIKSGNKITNQSTIPLWIFEDKEYLKACVRGLIDTDGSVYELLPHWPGLFQIYFGNRDLTLLRDLREVFLKLDYKVSKLSNLKPFRLPCFYITRKTEIARYYREIGFHNPKHSRKLKDKQILLEKI